MLSSQVTNQFCLKGLFTIFFLHHTKTDAFSEKFQTAFGKNVANFLRKIGPEPFPFDLAEFATWFFGSENTLPPNISEKSIRFGNGMVW